MYDEFSFDTAVAFDRSIELGLEASELFVLFASRHSIKSEWVDKELSQAHALKLAGKIDSIAVIIHRELAQCYYEEKEYKKAMDHLAEAHKRDKDNRYVVDLEIQIAVKTGDRKRAEDRLVTLRLIDDEHFYLHRKSTVEYRFQEPEAAYQSSKRALVGLTRPPFAFLSQLIKCEIKTDRLDDAKSGLDELERKFRTTHHDIRLGLRCKYEIARGNWNAALGLWERIREKNRPVHLILRYLAMNGKILDGDPSPELLDEFATLRHNVASFDLDLLDQELGALSD